MSFAQAFAPANVVTLCWLLNTANRVQTDAEWPSFAHQTPMRLLLIAVVVLRTEAGAEERVPETSSRVSIESR
jgi:hypothetical protein